MAIAWVQTRYPGHECHAVEHFLPDRLSILTTRTPAELEAQAEFIRREVARFTPLKKAHLRRWRAHAALRRTHQVRLAPAPILWDGYPARRLASGPF